MSELTPPPLPPIARLIVLRGRCLQVEKESLPNVSGGGVTAAGWGYSRVQTTAVRNSAFWLRTPDGLDRFIDVGDRPLPPMMVDHPISVVFYQSTVCAICNHQTNQYQSYRPLEPEGPYRRSPNGCMPHLAGVCLGFGTFVFFPWLVIHLGVLGLAVGVAIAGVVGVVGSVSLRRQLPDVRPYNQTLDQQVERLLSVLPGASGGSENA